MSTLVRIVLRDSVLVQVDQTGAVTVPVGAEKSRDSFLALNIVLRPFSWRLIADMGAAPGGRVETAEWYLTDGKEFLARLQPGIPELGPPGQTESRRSRSVLLAELIQAKSLFVDIEPPAALLTSSSATSSLGPTPVDQLHEICRRNGWAAPRFVRQTRPGDGMTNFEVHLAPFGGMALPPQDTNWSHDPAIARNLAAQHACGVLRGLSSVSLS